MTVEKINLGFNIEKIFHVGDIHIRNIKRHDEYVEIFEKFYAGVKQHGTERSVICILGDLAHSKCEMSPELIRLISSFLRNCVKLCPTILIGGNHDANLNNKNRLDALTPIVENLDLTDLYYLKHTGVWMIENCLFSNMSVFDDDSTNYVRHKNIDSKYRIRADRHIALFHGAVHNASTDVGYQVNNHSMEIDIFDGYDMVLLADIHKHQVLQERDKANDKPAVAYVGSLVQQNHGESLDKHGYCVWDIDKCTFEHYHLENDYGFYTIEIKDDKLDTDITKIPKKARLRTKVFNSSNSSVKSIISDLRKTVEINELTINNCNEVTRNRADDPNAVNVHSLEEQNKLITEYINRNHPTVDYATIEKIIKINEEVNAKIVTPTIKNIMWAPKEFTFSNMFSYGEDNRIEFSELNGIYGIFAPNASGKSSIIDALSFCLFDKSPRASKAVNALNTDKDWFKCQLKFSINDKEFIITRDAKKGPKGDVKVTVNFVRIDDGVEVSLNGEERRGTNDIIRDYIGTYEDFILTSVSLQNNNTNFINKGQADRKDLLAQFLGVDIFEKLYMQADDDTKEMVGILKKFNKDDFTQNLADYQVKIEDGKLEYSKLSAEKKALILTRDNLSSQIESELSKIITLSNDVPTNGTYLETRLKAGNEFINSLNNEMVNLSSKSFDSKFLELKAEYNKYKENKIEERYKTYQTLQREFVNASADLKSIKSEIERKMKTLQHLEKHEYDPNCKFCTNNEFVKDAQLTKQGIEADKVKGREIYAKYQLLENELKPYEFVEGSYNKYQDVIKETARISEEQNILERSLNDKKIKLQKYQSEVKTIQSQIDLYYKSQTLIENNKKINAGISDLKMSKTSYDNKIKGVESSMLTLYGNVKIWIDRETEIKKSIAEAIELEEKQVAYKYYLDAVKRDGIPYDLISKTIPIVETEINNILSQICEFGIVLHMDGKNINILIVYEDKSWQIELASGMEQFISSLALRVALTNISALPRSNFIMLDEGLGCLDSDHFQTFGNLMSYLKTQFEFVILISHIDLTRDYVESSIEIKKENGYSKVYL